MSTRKKCPITFTVAPKCHAKIVIFFHFNDSLFSDIFSDFFSAFFSDFFSDFLSYFFSDFRSDFFSGLKLHIVGGSV